ncbi:hypothetical protein JTB14_034726 [Gonioctena quinquepunctata]|nr:hypothetical protein JTB14_034726 [Gonioctena quinquepunctata]
MVAEDVSQGAGIDFVDTFSPVARIDTTRTVLSVSASANLHLPQFDVKTSFLNKMLEEEIYMEQQTSYQDGTNRVCKLLRSFYGLKQAPRCWNRRFT